VRHLITGPLHWLGMTDLAAPEQGGAITAFRLTAWSVALLRGGIPDGLPREAGRLHAAANGRISVPRLLPRAARYQLARFCEWEDEIKDGFRYHLTTTSLVNATRQGLRVNHLLGLLTKYASAPLPPAFLRALHRWELNGTEARLEQPLVLRLSRPEVLEELRKSKAGRFLGEILGPTAIVVKAGARAKVLAALAELGLLAEDNTKTDIITDSENHHETFI